MARYNEEDYSEGGLGSLYQAPTAVTAPAAPTSTFQIPSGLTPFQLEQYKLMQHVVDTPVSSYIPSASDFGTGLEGFLNADAEYQGYLQSPWLSQAEIDAAKQRAISRYQGKDTNASAQAAKDYAVSEAQQHIDYANSHPDGGDDWMDKLMGTALPIVVGGIFGSGILSAMGGAAGGAASGGLGSAGADVALGSLPVDYGALGDLGWASGLGGEAAAGAGAAAGAAGGLGSMVGIEGGAPAVVTVTGSAGTGAGGLGGLGAIGAGAIGAGAAMGGGGTDPDIPTVVIPPPSGAGGQPSTGNGSAGSDVSLPPLVIPPIGLPDTPATNPSAGDYTPPTTLPVPSFPLPVVTGGTGTTGGTTTGGTTTPTGNIPWSDVIGGIGDILGAGAGYVMNQADKDYYQGLMDKMMGMYQPGTPEATLMEQKMNAQDAAAGRNSQYGIRAQNLAGMLAEQRGKIMTSPVFGQMAQASRGHYDQSLNGIFSALGSATTSGSSLNNLLGLGSSALGNLFSSATAPTR